MNEPVGRFGILDPGARAADRLRDGDDRRVLADHPLVQLLLHADEALRLGFGELEDRDARPHRDDVGDLFLADLGLLGLLRVAPLVLELALLLRQLALLVAQRGGLLELLALDRGFLVLADLLDLLFELAVARRRGHRLDAHPRRGLVDQVDRLVGQVAVLDVAGGERRRGLESLVRDLAAVVRLVAVAQAAQDLHGVVGRRLLDADLLEAPLERGVALEVLAVLVERRRADRLQLAARERRLQDRRGVDRAFGGAGADEIVELVDEQDDVAALGDLLHHLLQALLELAAVLRARDERSEVERVDLLVLEQVRHLVGRDARRQALDDGGLADARLADQHRVVLRAARQDLHHALDLGLAADDRVELALLRLLRQVAAELVEQLRALALLARRALRAALPPAGAGEHADDLVANLLGVGVEVEQDPCGDALVLAHEPEQDVLGADVVVAERERFAQRELEHLLRARRERNLARRHLVALADDARDLGAHLLDRDVERLEHPRGEAFFLAQQAEQDVLRADVVVLQRPCLVLGEDDDLASPLCEPFEHSATSLPPVGRRQTDSLFPGGHGTPPPGCDARTLRREEDHVADRVLSGQDHREPVDAEPAAAGRRHPVRERLDVVRVALLGLDVAAGALLGLHREPLAPAPRRRSAPRTRCRAPSRRRSTRTARRSADRRRSPARTARARSDSRRGSSARSGAARRRHVIALSTSCAHVLSWETSTPRDESRCLRSS